MSPQTSSALKPKCQPGARKGTERLSRSSPKATAAPEKTGAGRQQSPSRKLAANTRSALKAKCQPGRPREECSHCCSPGHQRPRCSQEKGCWEATKPIPQVSSQTSSALKAKCQPGAQREMGQLLLLVPKATAAPKKRGAGRQQSLSHKLAAKPAQLSKQNASPVPVTA